MKASDIQGIQAKANSQGQQIITTTWTEAHQAIKATGSDHYNVRTYGVHGPAGSIWFAIIAKSIQAGHKLAKALYAIQTDTKAISVHSHGISGHAEDTDSELWITGLAEFVPAPTPAQDSVEDAITILKNTDLYGQPSQDRARRTLAAAGVAEPVNTPVDCESCTEQGPWVACAGCIKYAKPKVMSVPPADFLLIEKIASRATLLGLAHGVVYTQMEAMMDLKATHANGCPLDLEGLLAADDADLAHDVFGIRRHLDRSTGVLGDCFWPRYAQPEGGR